MTDAKLIPEPPLLVLPSLAAAVGLNEAIVLQQIHFRTRESDLAWWRASVPELRGEFPFWSEATVKRALRSLRSAGLVKVRQAGTDRTNQYRVQYAPLQRVSLSPKRAGASGQSDPVPISLKAKRGNDKRESAPARDFSRFDEAMR